MKKLTKIGASALAGSLVAVSAQAGELTASGTWELTYKSDDKANTGNPFGSKSTLVFSGSGDVDGLGTAAFYAATNDNNPAGFLSHNITLDMGDKPAGLLSSIAAKNDAVPKPSTSPDPLNDIADLLPKGLPVLALSSDLYVNSQVPLTPNSPA